MRPFLFAYSPKGKKKLQTKQERKDKARGQAKDNQNKADKAKDKSRSKEIKRKAKGDRQKMKNRSKHATSHKSA